jgi:DegV family protein with EDD domain
MTDSRPKVAIVVDRAAALPQELVARYELSVVPLNLTVGSVNHRDGELDLDDLLSRLDEGVTTSAPSPGEYAAAIASCLERAGSVLVITVSSDMSSSYQSARLGALELADADVRVFDSGTAAGAEGLVAVAAARAARRGADADEVAATAEKVAGAVRLVATLDSLDRLVASGRVPGIAGWAGRQLHVNPLFEFRAGEVRRLRPAFSRDAALHRIVDACRDAKPKAPATLHAVALHARAAAAAESILEAVSEGVESVDSFVGPFSPVMVSHTGPGLAGLAWWWET